MSLQPQRLVLLAIDAFGGNIEGRTLLQKRMYFIAELLNENLGYRAHYYGPYSGNVADAMQSLKASAFVQESYLGYGNFDHRGFERARCDYRLTEDGKTAVKRLREREPDPAKKVEEAAKRIIEAGNFGYIELSIAAKTHYILKKSDRPLTSEEIQGEARKLSWVIQESQIESAVEFLLNLGIIKTSSKHKS